MPVKDLLQQIAEYNGPSSLPLDSSQIITSQDAESIGTAIENNPNITSVRTGNIMLTPRAAASLFQFFLASSRVHKLRMPLWGAVYHASQRPLMQLADELPEAVEYYNEVQKRNLFSFNLFMKMNGKNFKCTQSSTVCEDGKSRRVEIETTHYIPEVTLREHLKPFLVGPRKTLIL